MSGFLLTVTMFCQKVLPGGETAWRGIPCYNPEGADFALSSP